MEALLTTTVSYAPSVVIAGPKQIGNCEGIRLDAGASLGDGGRSFTGATWELISATGTPELDSIQLGKIRVLLPVDSEYTMVELPGDLLPVSQAYLFRVHLTNWLGNSQSATYTVNKMSNSLPKITVESTVIYIKWTEGVSVPVTVQGNVCGISTGTDAPATKVTLMTSWTQSSGFSYISSAWDLPSSTDLVIPAETLLPGLTFVFTLTVWDPSEPDATNTQDITVVVEEVATPTITSATFDNTFVGIEVVFSQETNEPEGCKFMWDVMSLALFGGDPKCVWTDPATLHIALDSSTYNLVPGDTITILTGAITSTDGLSDALSASIVCNAPALLPPPVPIVQGALSIGSCDDVFLDLSLSSGGAGKPMTIAWSIEHSTYLSGLTEEEYATIETHLGSQTSSLLHIPSALLKSDRSYQLVLTLSNWVGATTTQTVLIEKSALDFPQVVPTDASDR
jgi:hypothetical protein